MPNYCCIHGSPGHIGPKGEKHAGCSDCFPAKKTTPHCKTCRCKEDHMEIRIAGDGYAAVVANSCIGPKIEKEFWDRIKKSIRKNMRWVSLSQLAVITGLPPEMIGRYANGSKRFIQYRYDPEIGNGIDGISGNKYDLKSISPKVRADIRRDRNTVLATNFRQFLSGKPRTCYHNKERAKCTDCNYDPRTYNEFRPYSHLFHRY